MVSQMLKSASCFPGHILLFANAVSLTVVLSKQMNAIKTSR